MQEQTTYESRKSKYPSTKLNFTISDRLDAIFQTIIFLGIIIISYWLVSIVIGKKLWPLYLILKFGLFVIELPTLMAIAIFTILFFALALLDRSQDRK